MANRDAHGNPRVTDQESNSSSSGSHKNENEQDKDKMMRTRMPDKGEGKPRQVDSREGQKKNV